ncbi:MAG: CDP-diacylglycerol--glycerol-3-phosphate 3-phosphatidyltransferase [Ruminococcus sp.]|jgi:CDP-diacylglycerol--glycerol-3-phosphate 3-phosphatidyltransferase|nr:CDP-diacylglycerol--glycerol-3-phosphate 3-phosphatidyltransferase [Ruminococcus sp.]MBQ1380855.1 CDP-diacylglycerol--glycerol-3-phosphate 3-phosphatidyltransferase [Ruminococcus sp.]MBQ1601949.1 CDP-diacylglycerol--glycerol-3-phosphate 3-phosphatidyltransferase [Ruminococcus sp.]MBQ1687063.1 CDP-diacylglycerol--glycerol-3-phosphate 3-phosphatidyltransferase [Ruminococcus sp.]MBQ1806744.1 CDP-diacylglycerol--glycerol-3-phosphate 3-phosphatidyltransferase [Ruminococcus sp.]
MNLPNKLTVARILLVPFFVAALLIDFPLNNLVALALFGAASLTDMFDGKIARKHGLITDFGKFADPLADKILVISALLCFVQLGLCDCVAVIIVLFREFVVTSIRLIAAAKGKVIAANMWGKVKTVTQIVAIVCVLAMQTVLDLGGLGVQLPAALPSVFTVIGEVLIWISTFFAVLSGVVYVAQNRQFISEK